MSNFHKNNKDKPKKQWFYVESLIGKNARIIESLDKSLISKFGLIVDESRNILKIRSNSKDQRLISVPKCVCVFEIESDGNKKIVLKGNDIPGTVEERIHRF